MTRDHDHASRSFASPSGNGVASPASPETEAIQLLARKLPLDCFAMLAITDNAFPSNLILRET